MPGGQDREVCKIRVRTINVYRKKEQSKVIGAGPRLYMLRILLLCALLWGQRGGARILAGRAHIVGFEQRYAAFVGKKTHTQKQETGQVRIVASSVVQVPDAQQRFVPNRS